jgi:hypothetical protein
MMIKLKKNVLGADFTPMLVHVNNYNPWILKKRMVSIGSRASA